MIVLRIDQLKPGMILAESVYNQQELLLFEKGMSLTQKRIWTLKAWGIEQVRIKAERKGTLTEDSQTEVETQQRIESDLQAMFADVLDDPVMVAIMKAAGRQLQKSLNDQKNANA